MKIAPSQRWWWAGALVARKWRPGLALMALGAAIAAMAQELLPLADGYDGWAEPDASHRLEFAVADARVSQYLDLAHLYLPATLEFGLAVRTGSGQILPYHFHSRERALIVVPPDPERTVHVYFGFPGGRDGRRPESTWNDVGDELGPPPAPHRLALTVVQARMNVEDEVEVLARRDYLRHLREQLVPLDHAANSRLADGLAVAVTEHAAAQSPLADEIEKAPDDESKAEMWRRLSRLQEREEMTRQRLAVIREQLAADDAESRRQALADAVKRDDQLTRLEREIERFFPAPDSRRHQPPGTSVGAEYVMLADNPVNQQRSFAARFAGRLRVTQPGNYAFAINSRNASHLLVDQRLVVAWPHAHPPAAGWEKTGEVQLDAGFHEFAFYYQTNQLPAYAAAAWRGAGEQHFRLLTSADFLPAGETTMVACVSKDGHDLPVVRAENRGWFLQEDNLRSAWIEAAVLPQAWAQRPFSWMFDGRTLATAPRVTLALPLADDAEVAFSLAAMAGEEFDVPVTMAVDTAERRRHDPDLRMTLWTPSFIYDDERLQMDVELTSGLTENCRVRLRTEPDRQQTVFAAREEWLELPGRHEFTTSAFSPSYVWKTPVWLVGAELADGVDTTYILDLPPLIIDRETVRFIPLPRLPDGLRETPRGLVDAEGRRIIPLLHRLTLAEKRQWALSKAVAGELVPRRKILIVADDFAAADDPGLSRHLRQRLGGRRTELVFLPWPKPPPGGTTVRAGVAELLPILRQAAADRVLIIPPAADLADGIPVRLQKRALAALVETCHHNPQLRTLALATPFPSRRDSTREAELVRAVYELANEYAAGCLDLNRWLRSRQAWESAYRRDLTSSAVYETLPVHWSEDIANYLLDNIL